MNKRGVKKWKNLKSLMFCVTLKLNEVSNVSQEKGICYEKLY
jgi:hypothetical protein